MRPARPEGIAGLVAAALFLTGFGLLATAPAPADPAADVVAYLDGHRARIFAGTILLGFGSCAFFWFLAGLRDLLDAPRPALASVLAATTATVLVLAGMSVLSGVVLHLPGPDLAVFGFDVFNGIVTMGAFGFGFSLVAAAAAGGLPPALRTAGLVIGPLQLATVPGLFVQDGFFAPLGPMALIAFWLLTGWYVAVAVRMIR